MPSKTNSDKISELEKQVERLTGRIDTASDQLEKLHLANSKTQEVVAELRRECEKEIALSKAQHEKEFARLDREIRDLVTWKDDQKKQHDEWDRRLWAFGPNTIGVLVSVVLSAVVATYLSSRR